MIFHLVEYILSEKASTYACTYVNIFQEIMSSRDSTKDLTKDTNATNAQIALSRSHSRKFEYIIPKTQK